LVAVPLDAAICIKRIVVLSFYFKLALREFNYCAGRYKDTSLYLTEEINFHFSINPAGTVIITGVAPLSTTITYPLSAESVKLVVTVLCKFLEHKQIQCLYSTDLTLPAVHYYTWQSHQTIFNSSNALLLVDADHFPDGTFTFVTNNKSGAVSILTPCSVLVIRVSLPYYSSAKTLV
jgi:hypothetical protein